MLNKKISTMLAILLAVIFTAAIMLMANKDLKQANKTVEVAQTEAFIPVGSIIEDKDITMVPVQQSMAKDLIGDKESIVGKAASVSLVKGQYIFKNSIKPGDGKKDGHVEVYVPCNMNSSAMAMAGEKVDIYLIDKQNREAFKAPLLYQGAVVLHSIDQQGKEIEPGGSSAVASMAPNSYAPSAVGIEVPGNIAEQLVHYAAQDAVYLVKSGNQQ